MLFRKRLINGRASLGDDGWTRTLQRPVVQFLLVAFAFAGLLIPCFWLFSGSAFNHAIHGQAAANYLNFSLLVVQTAYTVATIFLLWFNAGLFEASQEQSRLSRAATTPIIFPSNFAYHLEKSNHTSPPQLHLHLTRGYLMNVGGGAAFDVRLTLKYCGIDFEATMEPRIGDVALSAQIFTEGQRGLTVPACLFYMKPKDSTFRKKRSELMKFHSDGTIGRIGTSTIPIDINNLLDHGALRLYLDYKHFLPSGPITDQVPGVKSDHQMNSIHIKYVLINNSTSFELVRKI